MQCAFVISSAPLQEEGEEEEEEDELDEEEYEKVKRPRSQFIHEEAGTYISEEVQQPCRHLHASHTIFNKFQTLDAFQSVITLGRGFFVATSI